MHVKIHVKLKGRSKKDKKPKQAWKPRQRKQTNFAKNIKRKSSSNITDCHQKPPYGHNCHGGSPFNNDDAISTNFLSCQTLIFTFVQTFT